MLRARTRTALGAAATLALAGAAASAPLPKKLPRGVSPVLYELAVPAGSEPTPEKVALGDKLFNEKRVSVNDRVACATCHDPAQGFVD
ncbi:MAG: cytochrome-c peroxidase, partial [Deltaproteobacteria bacterium]